MSRQVPHFRCSGTCRRNLPEGAFFVVHKNRKTYRRGKCKDCYHDAPPLRRDPVTGLPVKTLGDADAKMPRFTRPLDSKRYIITSAQNATPLEENVFAALKTAAKYLKAELVVIPFRYKNPTSVWTKNQDEDEWWGAKPRPGESKADYDRRNPLTPYLHNTRKKLNPNLVLAADVKMQPTAGQPLSGFEGLTGGESCILGHPKMQLKVVAAPAHRTPKILTTTGCCTKKNYTDTKQGKLGEFHHFYGAIIVEIDGKLFHLRQLNADRETGEFTDANPHRVYGPAGSRPAPRALGLIMGDRHARFTCPDVDKATFGMDGIVEMLDPEDVVWHDTLDAYSVNPHHGNDPFIAEAKFAAGFGDPEEEVVHAVKDVVDRTVGRRSVIVASNHDDMLARWIKNTDWRSCSNRKFYLETALAMLQSAKMTSEGFKGGDPFVHWVNTLKGDADIRCLDLDESYVIGGIEVGMHGHHGPGGKPGTAKGFARVGARTSTAHRHSPSIEEGNYCAGTSTPLRAEYVKGPGDWINGHIVHYANGKRSHIFIIDGKWRIEDKKAE